MAINPTGRLAAPRFGAATLILFEDLFGSLHRNWEAGIATCMITRGLSQDAKLGLFAQLKRSCEPALKVHIMRWEDVCQHDQINIDERIWDDLRNVMAIVDIQASPATHSLANYLKQRPNARLILCSDEPCHAWADGFPYEIFSDFSYDKLGRSPKPRIKHQPVQSRNAPDGPQATHDWAAKARAALSEIHVPTTLENSVRRLRRTVKPKP